MSTIKVNKIENTATADGGINIDSAGRVGLGVTPSNFGSGRNALELHSSGSTLSYLALTNTTTGSDGTNNGFNIIQNGNEARLFNRENADIAFYTNSSERCRILAAGGLTFNGDTAAANALDDYEEGTWTPSFTGRTLTTAEGTYTKIGRQVLVRFNVASLDSSLGAADRSINGLPFTAANINQNGVAYIGDVSGVTYDSGYGNIYARINAQGNGLQLLQKKNDGSTHTTAPALGTGLILRGYAWFTV